MIVIAAVVFLAFWATAITRLNPRDFNGVAEVIGAAFCIATIALGVVIFLGMTFSLLIGAGEI